MTVPAPRPAVGNVIEDVIARGDISKLNPQERTAYYVQLCQSLGLNPHTQPFEYITLNGKLRLYAKKDATDQLRKINGISLQIISQEVADDLLTIHVKATDKSGRIDEDLGVVTLPQTLKGDARANQIMKAVTKGKRRVTLSISGLGFLDESEIESIPGARRPPAPAANPMLPLHDPETGEIIDEGSPQSTSTAMAAPSEQSHSTTDGAAPDESEHDRILWLNNVLRDAAEEGTIALSTAWVKLSLADQKVLTAAKDRLHKPRAAEVDRQKATP